MTRAKTHTLPLHESAYRDLSMIGEMGYFTPVAPAFRDFSQAVIERLLKRDLYGWRRFTLDYLEQQAQGESAYAPTIEMGLTLQFMRSGLMKTQREIYQQYAVLKPAADRAKEEAPSHESAKLLQKEIAAVHARLALWHTEIERYGYNGISGARTPLITNKDAYSKLMKSKEENVSIPMPAWQPREGSFAVQAMKSPWESDVQGAKKQGERQHAYLLRRVWERVALEHDMQRKTEAELAHPHKREGQSAKEQQAPPVWRAFENTAYYRQHIYTRENALMQPFTKQSGTRVQAPHMHMQELHSGAGQVQAVSAARKDANLFAKVLAKGAMHLEGKPIGFQPARTPYMRYETTAQAVRKMGRDAKTQAAAQLAGAGRLSALPARIMLLKHVFRQWQEAAAKQAAATPAREMAHAFGMSALTFLERRDDRTEQPRVHANIFARERMAAQAMDRILRSEARLHELERDIERRITETSERYTKSRITEVSERSASYLLEETLQRMVLKTPPHFTPFHRGTPTNARQETLFDKPFFAKEGAHFAPHAKREHMVRIPLTHLAQGADGEAAVRTAPARAESALRGVEIYGDISTRERLERLLSNRTRFKREIAPSYKNAIHFKNMPPVSLLRERGEEALGATGNGAKRAMDFTARAAFSGGVGAGAMASNPYLPPYQNRSELAWREGGGESFTPQDSFSERAAEQFVKKLFHHGEGTQSYAEESRLRMRKLSRIVHTHVRRDVIAKEALARAKRGIHKQIARPADIMRFVPPTYRDAYGRTAPMGRMDWTELGYTQDGSPQPYREQRLAYHAGETAAAKEDTPAGRAPLSGNAREAHEFLQSYAKLYGGTDARALPSGAALGEGHAYAPLAYAPLGGDGASTAHITPFMPAARPMEQMVYRQSGRQGDMGAQPDRREIKSLNIPVQKKVQAVNADELPLTKGQIERLTDRIFDGIERRIRSERRRFGL